MRRANTACAQVSRISTQSKRLTRGHRLSRRPPPSPRSPPRPCLLLSHRDSILPFLPVLNALPFAGSSTAPRYHFTMLHPRLLSSPPPYPSPSLPGGFRRAQSLASLMSFTCQKGRECACSSQTKEKHLPVISEKCCGDEGGEADRQGKRGSGITGSRVKREMLREGDRKMRRRECCSV